MLERFYTSAGNPVNEILLKLNLPNHKSILTDSKVTLTKHGQMTKPYSSPRFIANCVNARYLKMEVKVVDAPTIPVFVDSSEDSGQQATVSHHKHCIKFKMNKKNYSFDLETFRDMLQICPNIPGQKFEDPPFEEDILAFIRELGYHRDIKSLDCQG
ncbi:hypothetical protein Tco_0186424, partial [Tanacetum coccineum]